MTLWYWAVLNSVTELRRVSEGWYMTLWTERFWILLLNGWCYRVHDWFEKLFTELICTWWLFSEHWISPRARCSGPCLDTIGWRCSEQWWQTLFLDADGSPPLPDRTSRMRVDHLRPNESKTKNEMSRSGLSNIFGMSAQGPSQDLDSGLRVKDESLMLGQTSEFSK